MTRMDKVANVSVEQVIKIAVLAVGGQGGGVLTNWIADLASRGGYDVQMTSVAGVAQRTGATIYYVEIAPKSDRTPVFALSPSPGDIDVLIASELMEAGRAVLRGFVTPDKTTLVASSHRILAVSEKQVPGDGIADGRVVADSLSTAARKTVCFDMEQIAQKNGTMISASLFGGLARSGALPFSTNQFEDVIRASGRGVEASLGAFRDVLAFDEDAKPQEAETTTNVTGPNQLMQDWQALRERALAFPGAAGQMALRGLQKSVDYQDLAYGKSYLDHVQIYADLDNADRGYELTEVAAKYMANAMCYDDILRVADLKTRPSRGARLRREQEIAPDALTKVTEYFHPRAQEIVSCMPVKLGRWCEASPHVMRILARLFDKGRRIRTDRIGGFTMLWLIAGLRPKRRKLLRHAQESQHLNGLITQTREMAPLDYDLACEMLRCQRLIKGYSDTHARGHSKFARVIGAVDMLRGRDDAAAWLRRLREAALSEESTEALEGALKTVASFAQTSENA